jgi:hypothetical protein
MSSRTRHLSMRSICLCLIAGTVAAAPPARSGIEVLTAYAGTWSMQTVHLDTPYSKAGREAATLRNDCWRSGDFYACNQFVDGRSKALVVFAYDAKDGSYASYPLVIGVDATHAGRLIVSGNVWTFPWQTTDKGKTTHFRVVNTFTSPQSIEFRQEYSEDGEHWLQMASGQERKVQP